MVLMYADEHKEPHRKVRHKMNAVSLLFSINCVGFITIIIFEKEDYTHSFSKRTTLSNAMIFQEQFSKTYRKCYFMNGDTVEAVIDGTKYIYIN